MPTNYEIARDKERGTDTFHVYWRESVKGKVRQRRASLGTKDEAETEALFKAFLIRKGEKMNDAAKSGAVYTIADLWAFYMIHLAKGRSLKRAEYVWKYCLEPHFGHLTVEQVDDFAVQPYIAKRISGKLSCPGRGGRRTGKPVAPTTVRNELVLLLACMNYCSHRDYKKQLFDPALIRAFDMPEASKPRDRALTDEEMDALLAAAAARSQAEGKLSRIELFIRLAYQTAGREFAIRTLTFDPRRVNFEHDCIDLNDRHRSKKKDKNRATVRMHESLKVVLRRALAESDQSVPLEKRYVLGHPGQIWPTFQRVVFEAGLAPQGWTSPARSKVPTSTGISPHTLRHTAATNMARAGIPLSHIAEFLGNTIAMVERVYKHLQPDHLKAAADVLAPKLRVVKDRNVA